MKLSRFTAVLLLAAVAHPLFADGNSTDPPSYIVNPVTDAAPTIDGIATDGEWGAAAPAAGDWVQLRAHGADTHNLRFQMLYDADNLYILGQTDYDNFPEGPQSPPGNPQFGGGSYNPNFYFDPNTDGEDFDGEEYGGNNVDGYQFAWDVYEGHNERRPTPGQPEQSLRDPLDDSGDFVNDYLSGIFFEAHLNTPFGNQGLYDLGGDGPNGDYRDDKHPGIVWSQNASNSDLNGTGNPGGIWEFAMSWDSFNASNPNRTLTEADVEANPLEIEDMQEFIFDENGDEIENPTFGDLIPNPGYLGEVGDLDPRFADPDHPSFRDNGLYAVDGPKPGDIWAFETSIITPDSANFLPSWSEPQGGDPDRSGFAPWGSSAHGRIVFGGEEVVEFLPADFNMDGIVDFTDFLVLSTQFNETVDPPGTPPDIDGSGVVDFADFLELSSTFNQTSGGAAAAVPEPSTLTLLGLSCVLLGMVRRRRK